MQINKDIYKASWLLYTAYDIIKDKEEIDEDFKDILLKMNTILIDNIVFDDGVNEETEEYISDQLECNEEIDNIIKELENEVSINNIKNLFKLKDDYYRKNNSNLNDIINNPTEETKQEVDKLLEDLNKELGE